jgi:RimJ/RimL family protein N-acetyltransferase
VIDVDLAPLSAEDFPVLVSWTTSAEFLLQWAGPRFAFPLTVEQIEEHYRDCLAHPPKREMWKAMLRGSTEMVGHAELNSIDRSAGTATISRVIVGDRARRGKGIGAAMTDFLLRRAFGDLGLATVDLYVFDWNSRAIDCYTRAGFRIDTRLDNARRVGDTYWSLYRMVMERPQAVGQSPRSG